MKTINIGDRVLGDGCSPFIVAEVSANHNGDIERAKSIIKAAKDAGAHAVKLQTYTPDTLTIDCDTKDFQIDGGLWSGKTLYDLYKEAYTPFEWHKPLFDFCASIDMICFSTPFDESAVDLLESLDCPAYKIASFEMVDLPLIEYVAKTGKPMIISTGMANFEEIQLAVDTAKNHGCKDIILLHCISAYPAPMNQCNLNMVPQLASDFDVLSGLSDHTMGTLAATTAIALGACFIEKHFTLSRQDKGPDSSFSLEPTELSTLVQDCQSVYDALGNNDYPLVGAEQGNLQFRRSVYICDDLKQGDVVTETNTRRIRPGFGLPPKEYSNVLGKRLTRDVSKGTPLSFDLIE